MGKTSIEWTERSWNPVRGCTRVSPGCGGPGPHGGCYAEAIAARFSKPGQAYHGLAEMRGGKPRWTGRLALAEDALVEPLQRRKPTTWFVNSMSDLFHEDMPDAWIDRVIAVMALRPCHTFQVLTKRSARMRAYMADPETVERIGRAQRAIDPEVTCYDNVGQDGSWPLPNAWLGVSAEDQRRADERVPDLLATPSTVRFVSAEPLLGSLDLARWLAIDWRCSFCREYFSGRHRAFCTSCGKEGGWSGSHPFNGRYQPARPGWPIDRGSGLDWIIAGGESGPDARPMHPDWARSLRDQCAAAGVPFHFKQWGAWGPGAGFEAAPSSREAYLGEIQTLVIPGSRTIKLAIPTRLDDKLGPALTLERYGKKVAGRRLDGIEHDGMPSAIRVCR